MEWHNQINRIKSQHDSFNVFIPSLICPQTKIRYKAIEQSYTMLTISGWINNFGEVILGNGWNSKLMGNAFQREIFASGYPLLVRSTYNTVYISESSLLPYYENPWNSGKGSSINSTGSGIEVSEDSPYPFVRGPPTAFGYIINNINNDSCIMLDYAKDHFVMLMIRLRQTTNDGHNDGYTTHAEEEGMESSVYQIDKEDEDDVIMEASIVSPTSRIIKESGNYLDKYNMNFLFSSDMSNSSYSESHYYILTMPMAVYGIIRRVDLLGLLNDLELIDLPFNLNMLVKFAASKYLRYGDVWASLTAITPKRMKA